MTSSRREFLERYANVWSERAAARRRSGAALDLNIAGALERIVASMRVELAGLPPEAPIAAAPADMITWRSPVFNAGGSFNPFAGTHAGAMLATAALMDARGHADLAARYREHAAVSPDPDISQAKRDAAASVDASKRPRRSRPIWTGPNLPPPDPTPFVAGPQLGLFA